MTTETLPASKTRRRKWRIVVAAVVAVVVVGAVAFWYFVLRDDSPPPVSIREATRGLDRPGAGDDATGDVSGTWTVDPSVGMFSDFTSSFVGYRVREELAGIGASTATGRTPEVTGSITIDGSTITAVSIDVDMTTLTSDDSRRDGQLRTQALETRDFPTAGFELTEPIDLGAVPAEGEVVQVEATGDLTLHGVTQVVTIPLEAERNGDVIAVTGSLDVVFADYDIDPPSSFLVLSVEDRGVFELQLFFTKT